MRSFMNELEKQGIASGSFSHNGLNYVYLERYNNLSEARRNYISDVKSKYQGDVWVLHMDNDKEVDQTRSNTTYANTNTGNSTSAYPAVENKHENQRLNAKTDKEEVFDDDSDQ